ncbi:MAG: glutamate--tRNA ligase [Candidatus Gracilibacteria bacterium]
MIVITRFAPSPTGYLHIGSLRTVLYNYLFAKKNNGKFMLRVEDTDRTRLVEGSIENMLKVLASVGLIPDEGPNNPGDKGPYYQSERLEIYRKYIDELLEKDKAYYCFCSSERLTELREEQRSLGLPTKYDKKCRYLSKDEIKEKLDSGSNYTVRLKVPENIIIEFDDVVKGRIKVPSKDVDEQVLLKTDGFPTYHLANVVDDHLMGVTHVIRGDEWTPSTPKHIIMYDYFGWEAPIFAHIPLLLGNDKKKLSKRTGDVAVEKYIEKGYLTEALINYISLLGWNPKTTEEFFTMNELIERFDLNHVHKAGAIFDVDRLNFFNSHYLKTLDTEYLFDKLIVYLSKYDKKFYDEITSFPEDYNKKIFNELKTRIKYFSEYKEFTSFFYSDSKVPEKSMIMNEKMKIVDLDIVKTALNISLDILKNKGSDFDSIDEIKNIFIEKIKEAGMKNGQVLWPVRCALSGERFSPGALELIYILGTDKSISRIQNVLDNY